MVARVVGISVMTLNESGVESWVWPCQYSLPGLDYFDKANFVKAHFVIVIAGSKGKERFRRPLSKGSNSSQLRHPSLPPLSSTCCSPLGAGVPAKVRWSWPRHVFGKGFICLSFISLLLVLSHSPISIISLFSFAHPPLSPLIFTALLYFQLLVDYLMIYFR